MDIIFKPMLDFISAILGLFRWAVILYVIINLLESFKIINPYSQFVYKVHNFLFSVVEPFLESIRRFLPNFGGIDLSPVVLLLFVSLLDGIIYQIIVKVMTHQIAG
jgi:YggT family protein